MLGEPSGSTRPRIPRAHFRGPALFAANQFVAGRERPAPDKRLRGGRGVADGFTTLVIAAQPDNTDAAVGTTGAWPRQRFSYQLGWDDEQVVPWHPTTSCHSSKAARPGPDPFVTLPPRRRAGVSAYARRG